MNKSVVKVGTLVGFLLATGSVVAGPGTNEAFSQVNNPLEHRTRNLDMQERLPTATQRFNMNQRLKWSKAQSEMIPDTEIAVFETGKPAYRPTKR